VKGFYRRYRSRDELDFADTAEGHLLCGLYVIIGNALQPGATVMTVVSAVAAVGSVGTLVIVVASTAKSSRRNRPAHEAP
jgi:hypothetical protein